MKGGSWASQCKPHCLLATKSFRNQFLLPLAGCSEVCLFYGFCTGILLRGSLGPSSSPCFLSSHKILSPHPKPQGECLLLSDC